ncbi:O-methyltransferase [Rhizodiscina lignyota]|uniref:O-methyltransferase n=1 Tax=Rhizodiscina lignyota TaxID=1504668 RepID=A0A9P4IDG4_9PEZI|nr:O-methyltransferase [Rhizodiscina lignyota]
MSSDIDFQHVANLASELNELAKDSQGFSDGFRTTQMREKARQILSATRDPEAQAEEYSIWMGEMAAVRLFHEIYAFQKIPKEGSITYKELAEKVGAETRLIERVGNMLVSVGILSLEGDDQVSHTPRSRVYLDMHPTGLMACAFYDVMNVGSSRWPDYFGKYGLKEAGESFTTSPFSFAYGQPDKNVWAIMSENKRRMEEFSIGMNLSEKFLPCLGMYDFSGIAEYAKNGPDKDRKLFVDVGCAKGHSSIDILTENPEIPAERCVLQDRPDVIEHVKEMDNPVLRPAEKQVIDFFKGQPVKGALVYYIRRCLHDWSDDFSVTILLHLREACAADSRVLICEQLLASPPVPSQTALDLCMMDIGGCERNESMFREVANRAGLEVVGIHRDKQTPVAVIECVRSDSDCR